VASEAVPILLERESELSELDLALSEAAQQGRGQVVILEAPAGLGKTSLLKAASQTAAEAGFICLRARASDLERDFAYGCIRQLLEPAVSRADAEGDGLFAGAAALSRPLFAVAGESLPSASAASSFSMLHGLYWLLNNLSAGGPVALFVDDLHWSDAESLRFLAYLAPRLEGLPLAVLASMRPEEHSPRTLLGSRPAPGRACYGPDR
jgi:predicted ATPase